MATNIMKLPSIPKPVLVKAPPTQATAPAKLQSSFVVPHDRFEGASAPNTDVAPASTQAASTGPLDLSSPEAQRAIATSLAAVENPGLAQAGLGFQPEQVYRDDLGMTHVRLDATFKGLPVFGQQVVTHLGVDGKVSAVTNDMPKVPGSLSTTPTLTSDAAIATALKDFGLSSQTPPTARLVVLPTGGGKFHLAYQVGVKNLSDGKTPMAMQYFVDAQTGKVLEKFNTIDAISLQGSRASGGAGFSAGPRPPLPAGSTPDGVNANTLYDGQVHIGETQNKDGTWSLEDSTRGDGISVKDAHNQSSGYGATDFKDSDGLWNQQGDDVRETGATDAQYAAEMTYDFYKQMFGRNSIDGKGYALQNNVHINQNYVNAFWDGTQMNYGDGDGVQSGILTSLDVGGHEITHGFTQDTSNLTYEGQSGGLNEAMSDIMGKGVEWFAAQKNPSVHFTWGVGEQIWTPGKPGDALRYMDDPTKDGYSIDNLRNYPKQTEVHGSSGIANNAFVLMVQGGKNRTSGLSVDPKDGIGMEKALKIMYRAQTVYFTPSTNFKQAAAGIVKAAADLYGANSPEVRTVKEAWAAVGCLPNPPAATTPLYLQHQAQLGLALADPKKLSNGNVVQKFEHGEIIEQPNGKIVAEDAHGKVLGSGLTVATELSHFYTQASDGQKHHISKDLGAPVSVMAKQPNGNLRQNFQHGHIIWTPAGVLEAFDPSGKLIAKGKQPHPKLAAVA